MEIGLKEGPDPGIYIMEGDKREFARMTFYSIESGLIDHKDFRELTQESIYQRLCHFVHDQMLEYHPITPIHKKLIDLTLNPTTMLSAITKSNSPNLFLIKHRIERCELV